MIGATFAGTATVSMFSASVALPMKRHLASSISPATSANISGCQSWFRNSCAM